MNKRHQQNGFTLIEMIMVIVIMGALSVVAIAKFDRDSFEAEAVINEVIQAIRYAQSKSMSNTGANNFQIAIAANGYSVTQNGVAILHPVSGVSGYSKTWSDVTLSPAMTIVFDGYGDPGLGSNTTFTVTKGSDSRSFTVEAITGFSR